LSLNSLTGGRLLPEVLGVRSQWHDKRDD
jgi:hypothetical protein